MARKWNKGDAAEEAIAEALQALLKEKRIRGYTRAQKGRELDSLGIDFLIFLIEEVVALPIQVKSSFRNLGKHASKHPLVPKVLVVENLSPDKPFADKAIIKHLKKEIINFIKNIIRNIKNSPS